MTGFFSSPQSQPQVPTPVEKVPGITGLGQALMNRYMQMLSGNLAQAPYSGFSSVYGGPGGTFPGNYRTTTPATSSTGNNTGALPPAAFSQLIQQMIQQAMAGGGAGTRELARA